jgi:hypothetical protein
VVFVAPINVDRSVGERLVTRVRDHFVAQFKAFVEEQPRLYPVGTPELKLNFNRHGDLFKDLYCIDFASHEGEWELRELQPENVLLFAPFSFPVGAAMVTFEALRVGRCHHGLRA